MYAVIVFLLTIVAWVMLNPGVGSKLMTLSKYTGSLHECDCDGCSERDCEARWSQLGVYRVFFSGTVFFGLMSLVMIGVKSSLDNRRMLQNGLWLLKVVILIATGVGAFFIDNDFFHKGWGWIALFGGFIFLIIQLILLIDFAHAWADSWVEKLEEGSTCHKWLLILSSLGMYAFSLTAIILMYVFYKRPNRWVRAMPLKQVLDLD
jgi:MFS family permease